MQLMHHSHPLHSLSDVPVAFTTHQLRRGLTLWQALSNQGSDPVSGGPARQSPSARLMQQHTRVVMLTLEVCKRNAPETSCVCCAEAWLECRVSGV